MRNVWRSAGLLLVTVMVMGQPTTAATNFSWSLRKAHTFEYDDKETLQKNTTLSVEDKAALIAAVTAVLRPSMRNEFQDYDKLPGPKEQARLIHNEVMKTGIYLVDLNGDGIPEVIAQPNDYKTGLCGATGNCSFWIFSKTNNHYALMYDSGQGNGWEMFTIEKTRTNGYLDIVLAAHISADQKELGVFKFSNGSYQQTGCYVASWVDYEHDMKSLDKPMIDGDGSCDK